MKKDFEFLTDLITDFFKSKSIKDTLSIIKEFEISGWEKWIQIEFAKYCNSNDQIQDWGRELRYGLDRRSSKEKFSCAVDFLIRQKYKQSPLAIEFKQHKSPTGCIRGMLRDINKLRSIKYSEDDLRGIWCVGVHQVKPSDEVKNLVIFHASKEAIEIDKNLIFSTPTGKTDYSVTVF